MAQLLRFANYSEIAKALGLKSGSAVWKWATGVNVGADQLRRVEELYERTFGRVEGGQPDWAQALVTRDEVLAMVAQVETRVVNEVREGRVLLENALAERLLDAVQQAPARQQAGARSPGTGKRKRAPAERGRARAPSGSR